MCIVLMHREEDVNAQFTALKGRSRRLDHNNCALYIVNCTLLQIVSLNRLFTQP